MYLGLSYLIQEGKIANETVLRYLTGHPVSKVTVGMFFIGLASLLRESRTWRHHFIAAAWTAGYFALWAYLANQGFFLTA